MPYFCTVHVFVKKYIIVKLTPVILLKLDCDSQVLFSIISLSDY